MCDMVYLRKCTDRTTDCSQRVHITGRETVDNNSGGQCGAQFTNPLPTAFPKSLSYRLAPYGHTTWVLNTVVLSAQTLTPRPTRGRLRLQELAHQGLALGARLALGALGC